MTIISKIYFSGIEIPDIYEYSINKSISDNNSSSSFDALIDNFSGKNGSLFVLGTEVIVKMTGSQTFIETFDNTTYNDTTYTSALWSGGSLTF